MSKLFYVQVCSMLLAISFALSCGPTQVDENNNDDNNRSDMTEDLVDMVDEDLPPGQQIKVATFNVKRFFDRTCDSGRCGSSDFEGLPSTNDFNAKVSKIQDAIRILDADVFVFQEIEKASLLELVMEPYKDQYPTRVFGEIGGSASIDVAIVTKGKFLEKKTHRQNKIMKSNGQLTTFAREFLEVHSEIRGIHVVAFGAHFVSKVSDDGSRRLAEGRAAANLLSFRGRDLDKALVVLGGDLNDSPESATLRAFFDLGVSSVSAGMSINDFYTHSFNGQPQIIDYVLFWNRPGVELLKDEVRDFHDAGKVGFSGSDHAAVRATFVVR